MSEIGLDWDILLVLSLEQRNGRPAGTLNSSGVFHTFHRSRSTGYADVHPAIISQSLSEQVIRLAVVGGVYIVMKQGSWYF